MKCLLLRHCLSKLEGNNEPDSVNVQVSFAFEEVEVAYLEGLVKANCFSVGALGNNVNRAAGGIAPVKGTLGAAQHLHPFNIDPLKARAE